MDDFGGCQEMKLENKRGQDCKGPFHLTKEIWLLKDLKQGSNMTRFVF